MTRVIQLMGPSTGGIRRHVAFLAEQLEARGWDAPVAGPDGPDAVVPVGALTDVPAARRALAVASGGAELVHAHGLKAGWVAATLRPRPKLVLTVHNLVLDEAAGRAAPALRFLEGRLPAFADATIAVSPEVARRFSGLPGAGRITVVPPAGPAPVVRRSAAEVRAELGVADGERLLVTAARLHPQKGLDVLAEAVGGLGADVRTIVFGEGPLRPAGLELAGPRPSVADELAAADVVVIPSRWESGPLVLFEAMQLGRPVVTTAVGAAPELVVDGETGRIVPPGDAAALASAIRETLADPDGARRMAEAGRRRVAERYGAEALVGRVEDVYRKVLGR
jgi:glycosyltransferase involved in cell wall biosynthesis